MRHSIDGRGWYECTGDMSARTDVVAVCNKSDMLTCSKANAAGAGLSVQYFSQSITMIRYEKQYK